MSENSGLEKIISLERLAQFWKKFRVGEQYQEDSTLGEIFNDYTNNIASGNYSHAEGYSTIASSDISHVQGKYNIEDTKNKYAYIIGNGSAEQRSNAHTVDWLGNAWYSNGVYVGGTSFEEAKQLTRTIIGYYTAIITTNWTEVEDLYVQEIVIDGITENDHPIVSLNQGENEQENYIKRRQFSKICRMITGKNKIIIYANSKTTTELPIQIQAIYVET